MKYDYEELKQTSGILKQKLDEINFFKDNLFGDSILGLDDYFDMLGPNNYSYTISDTSVIYNSDVPMEVLYEI